MTENKQVDFKYCEDKILNEVYEYVMRTYGEHYKSSDKIECFDAWIALDSATTTFRDTAMKYLWRYGKKSGKNRADLLKAIHYTMLCIYNDHYKDKK